MEVLIAGDYYPNRRVKPLVDNNDRSIISEEIRSIIQSSNISVVNFESPITEGVPSVRSIPKYGPSLFSSQKAADYIKEVGFDVATLANNHIMDYGSIALENTMSYLEQIGMKTVGVGRNLEEAQNVKYIGRGGGKISYN